jgi:hypothetical protein
LPASLGQRLETVTGAERLEHLVRRAAIAPTLEDAMADLDPAG